MSVDIGFSKVNSLTMVILQLSSHCLVDGVKPNNTRLNPNIIVVCIVGYSFSALPLLLVGCNLIRFTIMHHQPATSEKAGCLCLNMPPTIHLHTKMHLARN
jgi:hypothetical protein